MSDWRELTTRTATHLVADLQAGRLSALEVVDAFISSIESRNPTVNAVCTTSFERARAEAKNAASERPLAGLPVLIKDNQLTAGIPTTFGSPLRKDFVPAEDAGIVRRIRQAGGIVLGKTNIPEFSIGANTVNPLFGATGNPFNPSLTCGGSSGGSAVAVATDMAPLATGSDHGGSLRIPASFCGVVGFRATPGVVPNEERTITQTNYSVQGPIARNVEDAALLLSIIAGRNAGAQPDPMAFPLDASLFQHLGDVDPRSLKVAVSDDLGGVLISAENRQRFRERLETFRGVFAQCDEHDLDLTTAPDVDWHLRQDVFVTQYVDQASEWPEDFNPNVLSTYNSAIQTPMAKISAARRQQLALYRSMCRLFETYDLLIVPGMSIPPFPHTQLNPTEIDGKPVTNYMGWLAMTSSLTVVGHPVVTLPCGLDDQGTPFGIQVVGPAYGDHGLLGAAKAIEGVLAGNPATARPMPEL